MFKKGKEKTGGRCKGVKNRATTNLRERITNLIDSNFDLIQFDLLKLEPKDRVKSYIDLLRYALPALSNVSASIDFDNMTDAQLEKIIEMLTDKAMQNEKS